MDVSLWVQKGHWSSHWAPGVRCDRAAKPESHIQEKQTGQMGILFLCRVHFLIRKWLTHPWNSSINAEALVMLQRRLRSFCNYDSFLLPLLSLHDHFHQGWNNWFPVYANGMDLEQRGANTQSCCLWCLTFRKQWREFWIPVKQPDVFTLAFFDRRELKHEAAFSHRPGTKPSDGFHHYLFSHIVHQVMWAKLDHTQACRGLPINPTTKQAEWGFRLKTEKNRLDKALQLTHRDAYREIWKRSTFTYTPTIQTTDMQKKKSPFLLSIMQSLHKIII